MTCLESFKNRDNGLILKNKESKGDPCLAVENKLKPENQCNKLSLYYSLFDILLP
jgi:hypothetical protein